MWDIFLVVGIGFFIGYKGLIKEKGIKPKATMWAIRGAVTGRTRGADMTATLDIIGKENCLARAKKAIRA